MDTKEPLLRSDWAIYRGGAFMLTGTEDVSILDTEFDQVGGNAIFVNNYNRRTLVKGCHIHDVGASGVCFVGDPDAVRDPLFEYGEKNDLSAIDRTPGPKTNNYPAQGAVEDCLIHGIGRVERQPAGRADRHGDGDHRPRHLDLRLCPCRHQHRRRLLGRPPDRALRCVRHRAGNA